MKRPALLCLLALAIGGVTLDAHHSIAGIYDSTQKVTIDGTVVEFRFVNPHRTWW